jgi:hypothetical protein
MCCSEAICCGESDADPLQSRPIYLALWGDLGHTGTILGRVDNGGSPQGRTSLDSSNSTHSIEPEDYMDEEAEVEDPQPDSGRRSHNRLSTPKPGPSAPSDDTTKTSSSPTTGRKKSVFRRLKKRFRTRPRMVPALEPIHEEDDLPIAVHRLRTCECRRPSSNQYRGKTNPISSTEARYGQSTSDPPSNKSGSAPRTVAESSSKQTT